MAKCKACKEREATEASRLCFDCAEEIACEMAAFGFPVGAISRTAWGNGATPDDTRRLIQLLPNR